SKDGESLAGVNIAIKGTNKGTASDGEGHFLIPRLEPNVYTLEIRLNYNKEISNQHHISFTIEPAFWQQWWFKSLVLLFIIGAIGFGFIYTISRQNQKHKQEILAYKNKELREELETKNTKLMYSAVQNAAKNEVLNELKAQLTVVKSQTENDGIKKVIKTLNRELKNENYWKTFNTYFNEVDQNFIHEFLQKHGELTQNDQRLVALIRLNLSTNEIASLLNISVRGVEQSKYRLKKKIGLEKELNLVLYIQKF
ncbi:MAG: carboxypeptidase-like regulatory domain-containing protein, partial [Bacteroidia bacterium]